MSISPSLLVRCCACSDETAKANRHCSRRSSACCRLSPVRCALMANLRRAGIRAGAFPFTVREIVLMGRTAHRGAFTAPSTADRQAAAMAIDTLGIEHLTEREWVRVSGGERQLALVARALAQEPRKATAPFSPPSIRRLQ